MQSPNNSPLSEGQKIHLPSGKEAIESISEKIAITLASELKIDIDRLTTSMLLNSKIMALDSSIAGLQQYLIKEISFWDKSKMACGVNVVVWAGKMALRIIATEAVLTILPTFIETKTHYTDYLEHTDKENKNMWMDWETDQLEEAALIRAVKLIGGDIQSTLLSKINFIDSKKPEKSRNNTYENINLIFKEALKAHIIENITQAYDGIAKMPQCRENDMLLIRKRAQESINKNWSDEVRRYINKEIENRISLDSRLNSSEFGNALTLNILKAKLLGKGSWKDGELMTEKMLNYLISTGMSWKTLNDRDDITRIKSKKNNYKASISEIIEKIKTIPNNHWNLALDPESEKTELEQKGIAVTNENLVENSKNNLILTLNKAEEKIDNIYNNSGLETFREYMEQAFCGEIELIMNSNNTINLKLTFYRKSKIFNTKTEFQWLAAAYIKIVAKLVKRQCDLIQRKKEGEIRLTKII